MDFGALTAALADACRATEGVEGLVLLGSASVTAAARRDEWSDHDGYVLLADGRADALRSSLAFLPYSERIAARARESHLGFAVLYDDGHLLEFAAGTRAELGVVRTGEHEVVLDTEDGVLAAIAAATSGPSTDDPTSAADQAALMYVKLLVGVGRARRGERVSANQFVRTYAVGHLARAIRARLLPAGRDGDALEPVRRLELDYPAIGTRLADALDQPLERAAHDVAAIAREALEPGWPEFPRAAADALARRLGWET